MQVVPTSKQKKIRMKTGPPLGTYLSLTLLLLVQDRWAPSRMHPGSTNPGTGGPKGSTYPRPGGAGPPILGLVDLRRSPVLG